MKLLLVTKRGNVGLVPFIRNKFSLLTLALLLQAPSIHSKDSSVLYTVKEVKIDGLISYDREVVIGYSGINSGSKIYLDGAKIKQSIDKLWKLNMFRNISIEMEKLENSYINLIISVEELPHLESVTIRGVKKREQKKLLEENNLRSISDSKKLTKNLISKLEKSITDFFKKEGYLDVSVTSRQKNSTTNKVSLIVEVNKNQKSKISDIFIKGNEFLSDKDIKKLLKKTKEKSFLRIFKRSRFIRENFEEDLNRVVSSYKEKGFRSAQIISDSTYYESNKLKLEIKVKEGIKYYFGDIKFLGNSAYKDVFLYKLLDIKRGTIYNEKLLQEKISNFKNPYANDITNLYQNNGYLFSSIHPIETGVSKDTINFEIRIIEGKQAKINDIKIIGNTRTNDHVIYRELRSLPGSTYRKSDIIRSHRDLAQLNFFDTEKISPNIKNANPHEGLVDLEYSLEEKGTSQIELQAGYGNQSLVGTLGLSFKNFSINNIFNKAAYDPVPSGDGHTLTLRYQISQYSQTGNISISDPWFRGKKPNQLSLSSSYSVNYGYDTTNGNRDDNKRIIIYNLSANLSKRLKNPDDYFSLSQGLSYKHYNITNFNLTPTLSNGDANDLSYSLGISRNNLYLNPFFPIGGSRFSLIGKTTLPYSLFDKVDYSKANEAKKVQWIEYYKFVFKGDWYTSIIGKLVLKSSFNAGYINTFNSNKGLSYFERFFIGGSGMVLNSRLYGTDIVSLRGYPNPNTQDKLGDVVYSKFSFELRYPLVLSSISSLYIHTFCEAGASSQHASSYNPFKNKRSAGFGIRYYMPALGIIGFDFGYGFDELEEGGKSGWQTHFTIGQNL